MRTSDEGVDRGAAWDRFPAFHRIDQMNRKGQDNIYIIGGRFVATFDRIRLPF